MGIVIRQIKKEEIREVYELERIVFQPINYPQFVLQQFYDLMQDLFLAAVDENNEILGYTQGGINIGKKEGWILSLATKEEHRGKGIGEKLSQKVIALLKSKGVKNIMLTVHPENASAVKLYKRLGFMICKNVTDYYGDGEPRLVMELKNT